MKKTIAILFCYCLSFQISAQDLFNAVKGEVSFFSKAPIEDIKAENTQAASVINIASSQIAVIIPIRNFHFEKELMEEHFNEKYLESDKYPMASFKGLVLDSDSVFIEGSHNVTAKGILSIHGVEKEVELSGTISRAENVMTLNCEFKVALKEFNIVIPKLLFQNIAEIIDVKVSLEYKPGTKNTPTK